jgi:hypothetical protein
LKSIGSGKITIGNKLLKLNVSREEEKNNIEAHGKYVRGPGKIGVLFMFRQADRVPTIVNSA